MVAMSHRAQVAVVPAAVLLGAAAATLRRPRFIDNHDPVDATLLLTVLSKVSGTRYHEPSPPRRPPPHHAFFHRHLTT
jgi:hypothetical protein